MRRTTLALLAALMLLTGACTGANWGPHSRRDPTFRTPSEVRLAIKVHTRGKGLRQAVVALRDALVEELGKRGVRVAGTSYSGAVLSIDVIKWDPGSRGARNLAGGLGAGRAQIDLEVAVVEQEGREPPIAGRATGWVRNGLAGGSAMGAPRAAAVLIADAIAGHRRR
jgi:hypothetical protein